MRRDGFTLAETVVALVLFAAAATVFCQTAFNARMGLIMASARQTNQAYADAIRYDLLMIMDRAKLEEGGEIVPKASIRKNAAEQDTAQELPTARWSAEVRPTPVLDVHEVSLKIDILQGETSEEAFLMAFYVYRPGWYEDGEREAFLAAKREDWSRAAESRQSP